MKDEIKVNETMREAFFDKKGYMAEDDIILAWYCSNFKCPEHDYEIRYDPRDTKKFQAMLDEEGELADAFEVFENQTRPDVSHYKQGAIQPIDLINSHDLNFNLGSIVKYAVRCHHKGQLKQDLQKIIDYANFELERVENER